MSCCLARPLTTVGVVFAAGCVRLAGAASVRGSLVGSVVQQLFRGPGAPGSAEQALSQLDTNHDNEVGLDEMSAFIDGKGLDYASTVKEFASFDKDRNGKLNLEELAVQLGLPPPQRQLPAVQPPAVQPPAMQPLAVQPTMLAAGTRKLKLATAAAPAAPKAVLSEESLVRGSSSVNAIAEQLKLESDKELEARQFDQEAASIRANLTSFTQQAVEKAREAAATAVLEKAGELSRKIMSLEKEAARAEVQAAVVRAKMEGDLKKMNDLSTIARSGLAVARGP